MGHRGKCQKNGLESYAENTPEWCPLKSADEFKEERDRKVLASAPPTPAHYDGAVTPWDLERCMKTSGNVFVDSRRTDAIEYCFRVKDDMLSDLKKARHCIDEAIKELEKE